MSRVFLLAGLGALSVLAGTNSASPNQTLTSLPAWFEPNAGQFRSDVKFFSRGGSGTLLVGRDGAVFHNGEASLRIVLRGANAKAAIEGIEPTGARSSYLIGNDTRKWRSGVAHFGRVLKRQPYPGIDLFYYLADKELEFDFIVGPGADPNGIRLSFSGAGRPVLDSNGDLLFKNGLRQKRPVAYQEKAGVRQVVDASYQIARNGEVRFVLGKYDPARPLVIDPVLYSAYLGGDRHERANAITVDRNGDVWITGSSSSAVSAPGQMEAIQEGPKGLRDVFLARLTRDSSGRLNLVYWTQIGGASDDEATSITTDALGFIYLAGRTDSSDFPLAGPRLQENFGGGTDAFALKINPADSGLGALWFSQYYGGAGTEVANSVAVDSTGAIYFAGYSTTDRLPGVSEQTLQCCNRGGYEGFLVKADPNAASGLAYATFIGGGSTDVVTSIAVDPQGGVYLSGLTLSDDFPYTFDAHRTDRDSIFLARLDVNRPALDALLYATFIGGGSALDIPQAMALGRDGAIWIAGHTFSTDFRVTPDAYSSASGGSTDLFLLRFDYSKRATPDAVTYSTYLGGNDGDILYGMTVTPSGAIALAGYTYSTNFPQVDSVSPGARGAAPGAFVTLLDPTRTGADAVTYSAVFGGSYIDAATSVAADAAGNLFVSGFTYSFDFPVTDESHKLSAGGQSQSFVVTASPGRR